MEIVLFSIGILILLVLIIQSTMLYKIYRRENPKLNIDSKEWTDFTNLFRNNKIHGGYVVSYLDDVEEFMLHFEGFGTSHGYVRGKYLLENVWFQADGIYDFCGEEVPGRAASYDLSINNIVGVTPIEEYYGGYGDNDNEYCVTCTLKNGNKVQIIFEYKENGDDK